MRHNMSQPHLKVLRQNGVSRLLNNVNHLSADAADNGVTTISLKNFIVLDEAKIL
jgi:hypothetical protein